MWAKSAPNCTSDNWRVPTLVTSQITAINEYLNILSYVQRQTVFSNQWAFDLTIKWLLFHLANFFSHFLWLCDKLVICPGCHSALWQLGGASTHPNHGELWKKGVLIMNWMDSTLSSLCVSQVQGNRMQSRSEKRTSAIMVRSWQVIDFINLPEGQFELQQEVQHLPSGLRVNFYAANQRRVLVLVVASLTGCDFCSLFCWFKILVRFPPSASVSH